MITVDIYPSSYTISGHAGYAEQGNDIVCSAVSTAGQLTAHILSQLTETYVDAYSGHLSVSLKKESIYTQFVFTSFIDAIESIVQQYPENVKLEMHIA